MSENFSAAMNFRVLCRISVAGDDKIYYNAKFLDKVHICLFEAITPLGRTQSSARRGAGTGGMESGVVNGTRPVCCV